MGYECPLCGRKWSLFCRASETFWVTVGGGDHVCKKCAEGKKEEIEKHNEIFEGRANAKKDPNCKHQWAHPYRGRWYCIKCGATYNWLCGCGGSAYVCEHHYVEMIRQNEPLKKFLAEHSW